MLAEFTSLCRQTVTIAPRTGIDGYGVVSFGAAVSYRARISGKRRIVRDDQGAEVLSTHTV